MPFTTHTVVTLVTVGETFQQNQKLHFSEYTKQIIKQAFEVRGKVLQLLSPQAKCYRKILNHLELVDKWITSLAKSAMSESSRIPLRHEQKVMLRCNHRIAEVIRLITIGHPNRNKIPEPVPTILPFPKGTITNFTHDPTEHAFQLLRLAIFHHNILTTLQYVITNGSLKEHPRFALNTEYLKSAWETAWSSANDFISCQIMVDSIALHLQYMYGPSWPHTTNSDETLKWVLQQIDSENLDQSDE